MMISRRVLIIGGAAAAVPVAGFLGMRVFGGNEPAARNGAAGNGAQSAAAEGGPVTRIDDSDRILGDPDAPITIIEYSSLTCPHCANFHANTLPELKENWIDTGRARLVYRHFPLDQTALRAALVTNCFEGGRFFNLLETLFESQSHWARADDPIRELARIGAMAGMNQERFEACLNDQEEADRILEKQLAARDQAEVQSTPTFLIESRRIVGAQSYDEFAEVLRAVQ